MHAMSTHRPRFPGPLVTGFAALALACALVPQSDAGTATQNLAVSASVAANCTIQTGALAFGAYDPIVANATTALNATGTVTIACTKGSAPKITLDRGQHNSGANRFMQITTVGLTDKLQYQLYQPPNATPGTACVFPGSKVWGPTAAQTFTPTKPTSRAAATYNICGTVLAGQDVRVGAYTDTAVATVNF